MLSPILVSVSRVCEFLIHRVAHATKNHIFKVADSNYYGISYMFYENQCHFQF